MASTIGHEVANEVNEAVMRVLRRFGAQTSNLSHEAEHAFGRARRDAGDIVDDFSRETSAQGRKAVRTVSREVHEHPVLTVAMGAAIGTIAAALLVRRR